MHVNTDTKETKYSERIQQVPRSFIRDILNAATAPDVISFAGGLPNKKHFPVKELEESTQRIFRNNPSNALQYGITKGLPELREIIATFYSWQGIAININNIIITTGSQQALDIIGKTFINEGDHVVLEEPSYLGAIQAFSMYRPTFKTIELEYDGMNIEKWKESISEGKSKLTYLIPNFQNPSGTCYSLDKRKEIAENAITNNTIIVEDDPYGKIRFTGNHLPNIYKLAPNNTLLLGSFSKIIAPGFRLGWIIAKEEHIDKLEIAKQASDLHTDSFAQHIAVDYLNHNNIELHLNKIINAYKTQSEIMHTELMEKFPSECNFKKPTGGMFTWLSLPKHISSLELYEKAKETNVVFVPGIPFYINAKNCNTMRLNFSCSEPDEIREGIHRLSRAILEV